VAVGAVFLVVVNQGGEWVAVRGGFHRASAFARR
jgi:hypothetical protein